MIVQMYCLSLIVADVFTHLETPGYNLLSIFLGSIIIRSILVWLRERVARQKSVRIRTTIRQEVFSHLLSLGPVYAKSAKTGASINLLTEGIEKPDDYFTHYIPSLIHIAILLAPVIVAVAICSITFTLLMLFDASLAFAVMTIFLINGLLVPALALYLARGTGKKEHKAQGRMKVFLMDQILVIHDGRIIEMGNHLALLRANGLYCKMYSRQMELFGG